jgi:signal transduction histidine kinase
MAARTFAVSVMLSGLAVVFSFLLAWRFIQHLAGIYRRQQDSAEHARRASAAREELLGVVAHDLRNPLGAITLKAATIERHEADPRMRERAQSIRRLAARMEELIGSLLEAARIEAGRLSLAWKCCTVSELFSTVTETFSATASAKNVSLEQESVHHDLTFWADPDRVWQVLSNLVGNALKFTGDGGTVRIRAVETGFHVRFEVRDTGPGIAADHLGRVFDRFWHGDDAHRGTGLGLYIAKEIVEAHGGNIWVESRIGSGTAFIFDLPTVPPAEATEKHMSGERREGPPGTVSPDLH